MHFHGDHFALSDILKIETHKHYGLAKDLPIFHFEDTKDDTSVYFGGLTPREAYINFSEQIIKPKFGKSYLGRKVLPRVIRNKENHTPSIISGVGFLEEVMPLIKCVGTSSALHLEIIKEDNPSDTLQDSRHKLDLRVWGVSELAIGPSDESDFLAKVEHHIAQNF